MATITIKITRHHGVPTPNQAAVPLESGDILQLSTDDQDSVTLYFSPDLQKVLVPPPGASMPLPPSSVQEFHINSFAPGAYCIVVAAAGDTTPPQFPEEPSSHLTVSVTLHLLVMSAVVPVHGGGNDSGN